MASLKNTTINDTGFIQVASGTTAQRPSVANGQTRYNTDTGGLEIYNSATGSWNTVSDASYNVELLLVGGGGAGGAPTGSGGGGGGGGGGVVYVSSYAVTGGTSYPIVVGAGSPGVAVYQFGTGTRNLSAGSMTSRGGDTTGFGYTAYGGGNGSGAGGNATQGGSGGGARRDCTSGCNAGSITTGQGNAGGNAGSTSCGSAGGGGGAGAAGSNGCGDCTACPSSLTCGKGGDGVLYNWLGDNMYYGAGGGGSFESNQYMASGVTCLPPQGGRSGGGNGSLAFPVQNWGVERWNYQPSPGLPNTGGGGGGSNGGNSAGAGGSGIVMVRYAGPPIGLGGDVVQYNGYTVHVFRGSGTFIA